jgi:hypothetical protein
MEALATLMFPPIIPVMTLESTKVEKLPEKNQIKYPAKLPKLVKIKIRFLPLESLIFPQIGENIN